MKMAIPLHMNRDSIQDAYGMQGPLVKRIGGWAPAILHSAASRGGKLKTHSYDVL